MGYDLHITRREHWHDVEGDRIDLAEWQLAVRHDPELHFQPIHDAEGGLRPYTTLIDDIVGQPRFLDISAADLRAEVLNALPTTPLKHRARLLDVYIKLSEDRRDMSAMYWGFQLKKKLHPRVQRPLMRCIWLSRRLGLLEACQDHLRDLEHRFPKEYGDFTKRYPDFLNVPQTSDMT